MNRYAHGIDDVEVLLAAHPSHDQARAVLSRYCLQADYLSGEECDGEQRTAMGAMAAMVAVLLAVLLLATCAVLFAIAGRLVDLAPAAALALQHWVHSLSPGPLALVTCSLVLLAASSGVSAFVAHAATRRPA